VGKSLTVEIAPERVSLSSVVPNPRNPRIHPEAQLERLVASVRRFGQPRPILVRRANRMIVAGHGIHEACRRAGLRDIQAVLWDVDEATADAFMLGDNRLAQLGHDDRSRIEAILGEIAADDLEAVGYSAAEVEQLLGDAARDIDVVEVPVGEVADRFWISIRGPLREQAAALQQLQRALRDLPEVEVEVEIGNVAQD